CPWGFSPFGPLWAENPSFVQRGSLSLHGPPTKPRWCPPPTAKSCAPSLGGGSSVGSTAWAASTPDTKVTRSRMPALAIPGATRKTTASTVVPMANNFFILRPPYSEGLLAEDSREWREPAFMPPRVSLYPRRREL